MKAVILAVSLFLPLSFSVASAQPTKITVGYTSIAAGQCPAWMAKESGIFRKNGLDVQLVYFRGGTAVVAALLSREIPMSQASGALVVSASLRGLPYQSAGVVTTRTFIRENPDIARKYARSQVEAVHRIKTDPETGKKVLVKYTGLQDKEILERTYDDISADDRLPPKQYPTLEGLKNILEPLAETEPKAKSAKPEDFVDMRFIKELDESGFIDDLYKGRKR
jgi:ABC-type nitrate/sulfonate/bicarbonate transport system substrate-binding protein